MKTLHRSSRAITLEQFNEMDDRMTGVCASCGAERECCEPDAERYPCDDCGKSTVYGPHWWLMAGKVK